MEIEETGRRVRRHDGKDQWSLEVAPEAYVHPIGVGDLVSLAFVRHSADLQGHSERLWVVVVENDSDGFRGELDNQPTWIRGLGDGDPVDFTRTHVFQRMPARRST